MALLLGSLESSIFDLQICNSKEVQSGTNEADSGYGPFRQLQSMSISDDVVSSNRLTKVLEENHRLKNHVRQSRACYEAHILTLHKIIYLLKKQNEMYKSCMTVDVAKSIESLNLSGSEYDTLKDEQEALAQILSSQKAQIEEKDASFMNIHSDLGATRDRMNQLEDNKSAHEHEIELLRSELNNMNDKLATLSNSYEQMGHSHSQLQTALKEQGTALEQSQAEGCTYSRMLEQLNNTPSLPATPSQPWIVSAEEVHVTNQLLGTGAWGTVSLGSFRGLTVAVKQLHNLIISRHNQAKFLREMEISATIRHPNILQFLCCAQQDRLLYVVTEVMDMSAREAYLSQAITKQQSLKVLLHAGLALQYLHGVKPDPIIHRDISSCNVLLSRKGQSWVAKLSDFGAANFLRENLSANPGAAVYGAPEAFSNHQSTKIDVYSYGVLMIELMTHQLPEPSMRTQHLNSIDNLEIHRLISQSLSHCPADRPEVQSLVTSLRVLLNQPAGQIADCL